MLNSNPKTSSLPESIAERSSVNSDEDLVSDVTAYLEAEIQSKALVRNISSFDFFYN